MGSACQCTSRGTRSLLPSRLRLGSKTESQSLRSQRDSPSSRSAEVRARGESFSGCDNCACPSSGRCGPSHKDETTRSWIGVFAKVPSVAEVPDEDAVSGKSAKGGVFLQFKCENNPSQAKDVNHEDDNKDDGSGGEEGKFVEGKEAAADDISEEEKMLKRTVTPCFMAAGSGRNARDMHIRQQDSASFEPHPAPGSKGRALSKFSQESPAKIDTELLPVVPIDGRLTAGLEDSPNSFSALAKQHTVETPVVLAMGGNQAQGSGQTSDHNKTVAATPSETGSPANRRSSVSVTRLSSEHRSQYKAVMCKNVLKSISRSGEKEKRTPIPSEATAEFESAAGNGEKERGTSMLFNSKEETSQMGPSWGNCGDDLL